MRPLTLLVAALVAMTGTARANDDEDDDDEDGEFVAFKKWSMTIGVIGHGTRIGGNSEGGFGPALELAHGRGRWQYTGEVMMSTAGHNSWTMPALDTRVEGRMLHGSLGVRWLARQFRPDTSGGVELFLLSALGLQRFYFDDGDRLTRPELALGAGMQVRMYKKPKLGFRLDIRLLFTPNSRDSALVACRGSCMNEAGSSTGFMTGMGIAW